MTALTRALGKLSSRSSTPPYGARLDQAETVALLDYLNRFDDVLIAVDGRRIDTRMMRNALDAGHAATEETQP